MALNEGNDAALERRITAAYNHFVSKPCRTSWRAMRKLILERSPVQVVRMERAQGLLPIVTVPLSYEDKLLDPRWQRKRLQVLQRSDFTCEHCGAKDRTLHVHHIAYKRGRQPWEYGDRELLALCGDCHKAEHSL